MFHKQGSNFKGSELLPNANIKFLLNSIMMQCNKSVTNGWDDHPCQHLIDFTCNLICVIIAQILCSCTLLPAWHYHGQRNSDGTGLYNIQSLWVRSVICTKSNIKLIFSICKWNGRIGAIGMFVLSLHFFLQYVLHELHPDDIVFKVIYSEFTNKDNMWFQLKPNVVV